MTEYFPVEPAVLVFVLAAFLYLTDLGRLLRFNEILLVCSTGKTWLSVTPANGFLFNRRHAVFPRLFDPGSVVLQFRWPVDRTVPSRASAVLACDVENTLRALRLPRVLCLTLLPEIFIAIPVCYNLPDNRLPLLIVLLWIYSQILVLVGWLFLRRQSLGLSWKESFGLAFESVVCIPYAINIHRKVADMAIRTKGVDLLDAGEQFLAADRMNVLRNYLREALDAWLKRQHANSTTSARVTGLQERLQRRPTDESE